MIEQVKGTRNLFGAESEKYIHIFNAFCDAFVDYGYEFVELPILEHKELFIKIDEIIIINTRFFIFIIF